MPLRAAVWIEIPVACTCTPPRMRFQWMQSTSSGTVPCNCGRRKASSADILVMGTVSGDCVGPDRADDEVPMLGKEAAVSVCLRGLGCSLGRASSHRSPSSLM